MKQELFREIPKLLTSDKNFAYFCKFSDSKRVVGNEYLGVSDSDPMAGRMPRPEQFMKLVNNHIKLFPEQAEVGIPVFFSYDLSGKALGTHIRHSSEWPEFSMLMPEHYQLSTFERSRDSLEISRKFPEIDPAERERLENSIREVRDRIREGELLQAVISREFELNSPFDQYSTLRHFLNNDRSRYVYLYRFGELTIMGSSPENIFRQKGRDLTINPIAGTRSRSISNYGGSTIQDLLTDNKEVCEHRMLVDLARNDLSRISEPGSVKVTMDMSPEEFASVTHLVSIVNSRSNPAVQPADTLMSVFPAGTVSGAPKRRAVEIIDQYENTPRGAYAGGIGMIGTDMGEIALAIRSIFASPLRTYTQAGAGIVKDSDPEKEVQEILAKAGTVVSGVRK